MKLEIYLAMSKHFQQSPYWKEVKQRSGNETIDLSFGWLQITPLPFNKKVGYLPPILSSEINWEELYSKAKEAGCVFVTIDFEDIQNSDQSPNTNFNTSPNTNRFKVVETKSVRLPKNVIVDLNKSEDELLKAIDKKDRYNIRAAEKKGVRVEITDSEEALNSFLRIFLDTKNRKQFLGRGEKYIKNVWDIFKNSKIETDSNSENVGIKIANAYFNNKVIASWMLIHYKDTIYYPYGGSNYEYNKLNATYLLAWEIIKWGKNNGFKAFDMGGVEANYLGGYSHFKTKFGNVIEYIPSVDLVINPKWYGILKIGRTLRERLGIIKRFF